MAGTRVKISLSTSFQLKQYNKDQHFRPTYRSGASVMSNFLTAMVTG